MCGIAGQVARDGRALDLRLVKRMCAELRHRGPDGEGFHAGPGVALGNRRLAIIDVAGGDQPIANEDGTVVVVMNGEIYNFRELRSELEERGHRFSTHADTEVIVHLYEEHGPELAEHLRGMFAFAVWDARRRRLLLGRDRVGKKPLYYWVGGDGSLTFASELAALLEDERIPREADPIALDAFLALLYVPHPISAIAGVRKLPPASTLLWEEGHVAEHRYWELRFEPKEPAPEEELVERILDGLRDAVRVRLLSERPVGAFLSGGVDSAAVVWMMSELCEGPVKTFSIGFDSEPFNELPYARRVASIFGTDHVEHVVRADALEVLPALITRYGDPFGDSSAIPSYYVAQAAASVVTVALNGDGGDESFAGYNRYVAERWADRLAWIPAPLRNAVAATARRAPEPSRTTGAAARALRLASALSLPPAGRYARRMTHVSETLRRRLYEPEFARLVDPAWPTAQIAGAWGANGLDPIDSRLGVDISTYLPGDLLVKMDIATMAHSLEGRSPFLDHVLMETSARIPAAAKVSGTSTKTILKSALKRRLPAELVDRPKAGFSVPLADWLRGPLRPWLEHVLYDERTRSRGILRPAAVRELVTEHTEARFDRSTELWALAVLELWHRRFIDRESEAALF